HSINLARFYVPDLPVDTPTKTHLVDLSDQYYAESLRLNPNDASLWREWAEFKLTYRGDPGGALETLRVSVQLDDRFIPSYLTMSDAYLAQGDLDRAVQSIDRALALQPDLPEAVSRQAFVYFQQGRFEESIAAYMKYIQLAPDAPNVWEAHKNIALLREQLGDVAGALQAAQAALARAPQDVQPQLADWIDQLRARLNTP
ncbi:MAG TPA: tetratricopeptide repeat protein, partial [Anaerolineae bacterium]